jgi:hypothetical protein
VQEFQSIIVPYQPAPGAAGKRDGHQPTGAVGRDDALIMVKLGGVIGDQDQVDAGRGDAGLLP